MKDMAERQENIQRLNQKLMSVIDKKSSSKESLVAEDHIIAQEQVVS